MMPNATKGGSVQTVSRQAEALANPGEGHRIDDSPRGITLGR